MLRAFLCAALLSFWTGLSLCEQITLDGGKFRVWWDRKGDDVHFRVQVQSAGWVSFGFALQAPTGMRGYDVMMGGVHNGQGYIGDYYTYGFGTPSRDASQDFRLTRYDETNGITTLDFVRPLKTDKGQSDQPDVQLLEGRPVYLVWAYNSHDDRITQRHTNRGTTGAKYELAKTSAKPQPTPLLTTPTQPAPPATATTAPYVPFVAQQTVRFDGGKFLASWAYDRKASKLMFRIDVATKGWVSFGLAHKAPNNMLHYDIVVGGVLDNGYAYLYDYHTIGRRAPVFDIFQDYVLNKGSENNGRTVLEYERFFRTKDIFYGDVQFYEGEKMALVWAYHSKEDSRSPYDFSKHTNRGTSDNVKYDIAPKTPPVPIGPSHAQYQKQINSKQQPARTRRSIADDAANQASFDGGKFVVTWKVDASAKKVRFKVEAQTTGWVAFGFAKKAPNSMQDYDVVVGGVVNGNTGYLYDYYTDGFNLPPRDANQDYVLVAYSETNGKTTLTFERKLDTGDDNDVQLTAGNKVHLVWAYDRNGDSYGPDYFTRHTNRGYSGQTYDFAPAAAIATTAPPVDAKVDPTAWKASFDGGKFKVTWKHDSSEDKILFNLEVQTAGWVGFGLAKKANNNMKDYDVVVGGVLVHSGAGYLYDYYTDGYRLPPLDKSQDYKLTSSSQKNGKTSLAFERKLSTNDQKDIEIKPGDKLHLIWAYDDTGDSFGPNSFSKHSSRGSSGAVYELVAKDDDLTPTTSSAIAPTSASVPAGPAAAHSVSFDNGKFKVSWEFDEAEDKVKFLLDVESLGWIGFGFAKNAPNSMKDYDIIVGGAMDSGAGYLYDYYTEGFGRPPLDSQQDYKLIRAAESNGRTTLEFERKRDTGDSDDFQFTEGAPLYMVWAYHSFDSFGPLSFLKHDDKGTSDVEYDFVEKEVTSSTTSLSVSTTDWSSSVSSTESSSSATSSSSSRPFPTTSSSAISSSSSSSRELRTTSSSSIASSSSSSREFSTTSSSVFSTSTSSSSTSTTSTSSFTSTSSSSSSSESSSTMSSTDSSSSVFVTDSSSTTTSTPLSTESTLQAQPTTSSTSTSHSNEATPEADTSSTLVKSSTTAHEIRRSSPTPTRASPSTKTKPSSPTEMPRSKVEAQPAFSSAVVHNKPPEPTRTGEVWPTLALPETSAPTSSAVLVIEVVDGTNVPNVPTEGTNGEGEGNEEEETVSPDDIAFEPDFDLRNSASSVPTGLMNFCLAVLVYKFHQLMFL